MRVVSENRRRKLNPARSTVLRLTQVLLCGKQLRRRHHFRKSNIRCKRAREGFPPGLRTNSVKVQIHTISGFRGNAPGDLKWLGDKADSRIAPETCRRLSPQKLIREQALAAHSSGVSHGRDDVGPDFQSSTGGELL